MRVSYCEPRSTVTIVRFSDTGPRLRIVAQPGRRPKATMPGRAEPCRASTSGRAHEGGWTRRAADEPCVRASRRPGGRGSERGVALDGAGFNWVTACVWRETVGTLMRRAGRSSEDIAEQLGNTRAVAERNCALQRRITE